MLGDIQGTIRLFERMLDMGPVLGSEAYNHNSFHASREGADGESDATEVPSSVWIETVRGEKSADALGVARIQVDRKVVVTAI